MPNRAAKEGFSYIPLRSVGPHFALEQARLVPDAARDPKKGRTPIRKPGRRGGEGPARTTRKDKKPFPDHSPSKYPKPPDPKEPPPEVPPKDPPKDPPKNPPKGNLTQLITAREINVYTRIVWAASSNKKAA